MKLLAFMFWIVSIRSRASMYKVLTKAVKHDARKLASTTRALSIKDRHE